MDWEKLPYAESQNRIQKIKQCLNTKFPHLEGIFVFSKINIYYLTGTLANGILWLPQSNDPILFVRKGAERAQLESPIKNIMSYRSYSDIIQLCNDAQNPLPKNKTLGVDMTTLPWNLAILLQQKLTEYSFVNVDSVFSYVRSRKSEFELTKIREAGKRHSLALEQILPFHMKEALSQGKTIHHFIADFDKALTSKYETLINKTLSERDIALLCMNIFMEMDHGGLMRMSANGEEMFMGHVSSGDSGNFPHFSNVPMGFRGVHPALPCLGSHKIWEKHTPLIVDMAFNYQAYCTDKTQSYFYGTPKDLPDIAKKAYECCQNIHNMALEELKSGNIPAQIWEKSLNIAKKFDFSDNFMGYKMNAVPFLGHGIGLVIDEQPVIAKGFNEPLETNMVIAIEPKIGIPNFGMLGIENTIEITDNGAVNLSSENDSLIFIDIS